MAKLSINIRGLWNRHLEGKWKKNNPSSFKSPVLIEESFIKQGSVHLHLKAEKCILEDFPWLNLKSCCNIVLPFNYPEQRTVKCSGNTYPINAKFCPRQFVKSTASLCLNKYSLAERERERESEHKKTREGNWGEEDQVASSCSGGHWVNYMKQREWVSAPGTNQPLWL